MKNKCSRFSALGSRAKGFLIAVFCGLVLILSYGCAKKDIKNLDSQGLNIICFGDSITFGYGAQAGEDYPAALARMLEVPVINAGIDGDTSTEAMRRLKSDILERDPLLVIIEFGGNDFLRKIHIETTVKNIREAVEAVQAQGAIAAVMDISAGMLLSEYRREFIKLARQTQAIFISGALNGIITNPHLKSDFIHPNGDGYKVIAQRTYKQILPYLKKNAQLRKK